VNIFLNIRCISHVKRYERYSKTSFSSKNINIIAFLLKAPIHALLVQIPRTHSRFVVPRHEGSILVCATQHYTFFPRHEGTILVHTTTKAIHASTLACRSLVPTPRFCHPEARGNYTRVHNTTPHFVVPRHEGTTLEYTTQHPALSSRGTRDLHSSAQHNTPLCRPEARGIYTRAHNKRHKHKYSIACRSLAPTPALSSRGTRDLYSCAQHNTTLSSRGTRYLYPRIQQQKPYTQAPARADPLYPLPLLSSRGTRELHSSAQHNTTLSSRGTRDLYSCIQQQKPYTQAPARADPLYPLPALSSRGTRDLYPRAQHNTTLSSRGTRELYSCIQQQKPYTRAPSRADPLYPLPALSSRGTRDLYPRTQQKT
jgi:hypothetical protein